MALLSNEEPAEVEAAFENARPGPGGSLVSAKEERDLAALLDLFALGVGDVEEFQERLQAELAALEVHALTGLHAPVWHAQWTAVLPAEAQEDNGLALTSAGRVSEARVADKARICCRPQMCMRSWKAGPWWRRRSSALARRREQWRTWRRRSPSSTSSCATCVRCGQRSCCIRLAAPKRPCSIPCLSHQSVSERQPGVA